MPSPGSLRRGRAWRIAAQLAVFTTAVSALGAIVVADVFAAEPELDDLELTDDDDPAELTAGLRFAAVSYVPNALPPEPAPPEVLAAIEAEKKKAERRKRRKKASFKFGRMDAY